MYRRILFAAAAIVAAADPAAAQALKEEDLNRIKAATVFIKVGGPRLGATGSGFLAKADGETGYIVTNNHVIDLSDGMGADMATGPTPVSVVFDSGTTKERVVKASVAAADPDRDLAVLKVEMVKDLPAALDITGPEKLFETMKVHVCGFPFGGRLAGGNKNPEISIGDATISSIRRELADGPISTIQVNGALNPGNSGGPLVSTDGKLVGVAVTTVRGAGIGNAIPQHEVVSLMRGRVGRVLLLPAKPDAEPKAEAEAKIDVTLLDPLGNVKGVTAHTLPGDKPLPKTPVPPGPIPDATKVPLKLADGHATAEVKVADGGKKGIVLQLELDTAEGKVFTNALAVPFSPTAPGRINPRATMPADPNAPQRTPDGKLKLANGVLLPFPNFPAKFPSPSGSESVSNVNATPDAFVGKAIKLDAVTTCVVNPTDKNEFELAVETDADNPPADVRVVAPKDLALQLADLGIPELPIVGAQVKFPVRIAGKLAKPAGRERRYTFAAETVEFLDDDGKSVVTFKPEVTQAGQPTLAVLNRFPEKFVGQTLTLVATVKGTRNWGGTSIDLVSPTLAAPMNLEIYTSRSLAGQVDSDIKKEDLPARARVTVEVKAINGKNQKGVIGVKQIELLDVGDKPTKTLKTSAAVEYPNIPAAAKITPPTPKPADTPKAEEKVEAAAPAAKPAPAGGDNTLLIVALVGAVVLVVGGGLVLVMAIRKPKTGRADASNEAAEEPVRKKPAVKDEQPKRAAPTGKTTVRAKRPPEKPAAPADDNPFANFG